MKTVTLICNHHDCTNTYTEKYEGAGFPQWGHIGGLIDKYGNSPHVCPECMKKIFDWLKGDNDDLG